MTRREEHLLSLQQRPCTSCGELCDSQLEFVESNGGKPWETCSGCGVPEEDEVPHA